MAIMRDFPFFVNGRSRRRNILASPVEYYTHRKIPIYTSLESLPEIVGSNLSIPAPSVTPLHSSTSRGHHNFISDVSENLYVLIRPTLFF